MLRNLKLLTLAGTAVLTFTQAFADYSLSTNLDFVDKKSKRDSSLTGDFSFRTNQLVDDVGEVTGNQHFGDLNLKYQSLNSENVYKGFQFSTRVNDQEQMMYSIQEAVVEWRYSSSRFAMGRTTLDWSYTDQVWGLGKVNNRVNFDYFEPGQEGLVGFFYDKKFNNGFSFSAFGSFIYVPEMNPAMQVNDDGTIDCKNPWCTQMESQVDIDGTGNMTDVYYNVNYPEISDVVLRQSFGLQAAQKFKVINGSDFNANLTASAFYLRKPENNISTTAEAKFQTPEQRIFVNVTPQVFYHDVRGGNLELELEEWNMKLYGSAISIVPDQQPDGDNVFIRYLAIRPKKIQEDYLSSGLVFDNGRVRGHAGYIARVSEYDRENDLLAEFPRWNQAGHLALAFNATRKIGVSLDYKFDMLTEDRLTMVHTSYRFGPNVIAGLGVNIIGTNPDEESFWSRFENNDSVYSSLQYTF